MLNDILSPVTDEEFFRDIWGRKFFHVPGAPDKFSHFFHWHTLNRTLEQHQFTPQRLKVVKGGETMPAESFMNGPWVNAARLVNELSNGASLVLNECEDVQPALQELCVRLERLLRIRVSANLYAGWRENNGFNIHWDDQEVFILQVAGRKRWKVWEPTRLHPLRNDAVDTSSKTQPTGEPIWEAVIEPGTLLYIPRGWWHLVNPVNEPCLHITVTVESLTGMDFLEWFKKRMKTSTTARMDVPLVASAAAQNAWLEALKHDIDAAWGGNMIDEFLNEIDTRAIARPALSLPTVESSVGSLMSGGALELAVPRSLRFQKREESVFFTVNGCEWEVKPYVAEKLERFNDFQPHTLAELAPDFRVVGIVMALLQSGVLRMSLQASR
jgi:ribosomal protein L16 Arg81 hydroxylase